MLCQPRDAFRNDVIGTGFGGAGVKSTVTYALQNHASRISLAVGQARTHPLESISGRSSNACMYVCILYRNSHKPIGSKVPHSINSELSVPPSSILLCLINLYYLYIPYTMSIRPTLLRSLNARKAIAVRGISSTGPKRAGHQESHSEDDSTHTHECKSVEYKP